MILTHLSDVELIGSFKETVLSEREMLVLQLDHLIELDRRKLFFHYSSLSSFLVHEHGMEEWLVERRIRAARLMKRIPSIRAGLESGKLNLTLMEHALGCAHREKLSDDELSELLQAISGMTTRAAQREIATLYPETYELPKDRIRPLNEEFSEVRFCAHQDLLDQMEEIRGLIAHAHPRATIAELMDVLMTDYRDRHHPVEKAMRAEKRAQAKAARAAKKEKAKNIKAGDMKSETQKSKAQPSTASEAPGAAESFQSPTAPRVQDAEYRKEAIKPTKPQKPTKRTPSQALTHELVLEKGFQCLYIDPITGKRCTSHWAMQKDHIQSWSRGGQTTLKNMRFLCINHHRRVSFLEFGESSKYIQPKRV